MKTLLAAWGLLLLPLTAVAQAPSQAAPGEDASTVFTAEIISTRTRPPEPGARLLTTEVELALRTCVRGECPARSTVEVPGGRLGDIEQWVEDLPPPRAGAIVAVTLPEAVDARVANRRPPFARLLELTPPPGAAALPRLAPSRGSAPTREALQTPLPAR